MDLLPNKQRLIDKISSLLYDFSADQLNAIYDVLVELMYKGDNNKWKITKKK